MSRATGTMAETLQAKIDRLKAQERVINNRLERTAAQLQQQQERERKRVIYLWGEVVEAALKDGALSSQQWRELCTRYIPHEKNQALALDRVSEVTTAAEK